MTSARDASTATRARRVPVTGAWRAGDHPGAGSSPTSAPLAARGRRRAAGRARSRTRPGARSTPARDNAVLVLHALTGDSHVAGPAGPGHPTPGWWDGLIGPGRAARHRPLVRRRAQRARRLPGHDRPGVRRRRTAGRGARASRTSPSATRSRSRPRSPTSSASTAGRAVVGGSMGGMRALEWAVGAARTGSQRLLVLASTPYATGRPDRLVRAAAARRSGPTRLPRRRLLRRRARRRPAPRARRRPADRARHLPLASPSSNQRFGRARAGRRAPARRRRPLRGRVATSTTTATSSPRRFDAEHLRGAHRGDEPPRRRPRPRRRRPPRCGRITRAARRSRRSTATGSTRCGCSSEIADGDPGPRCALRVIESPYGHDGFLIETGAVAELLGGLLERLTVPGPLRRRRSSSSRARSPAQAGCQRRVQRRTRRRRPRPPTGSRRSRRCARGRRPRRASAR